VAILLLSAPRHVGTLAAVPVNDTESVIAVSSRLPETRSSTPPTAFIRRSDCRRIRRQHSPFDVMHRIERCGQAHLGPLSLGEPEPSESERIWGKALAANAASPSEPQRITALFLVSKSPTTSLGQRGRSHLARICSESRGPKKGLVGVAWVSYISRRDHRSTRNTRY
jgi:hypothetical protein